MGTGEDYQATHSELIDAKPGELSQVPLLQKMSCNTCSIRKRGRSLEFLSQLRLPSFILFPHTYPLKLLLGPVPTMGGHESGR